MFGPGQPHEVTHQVVRAENPQSRRGADKADVTPGQSVVELAMSKVRVVGIGRRVQDCHALGLGDLVGDCVGNRRPDRPDPRPRGCPGPCLTPSDEIAAGRASAVRTILLPKNPPSWHRPQRRPARA